MKSALLPDVALFVRVLDLGTFAAAADEEGLTASGVSRIVSRLETRLGVTLLHRSTRRLTLTPEGETFLTSARSLLAAAEAAEAGISETHGRPRGHLRINSGTAFASHKLAPLFPGFLADHPDVSVALAVNDRRIDPVAEQIDITIRVGPLADSDLVAVRLGTVRRIIAASPGYLARRGTPEGPRDLSRHDCLLLTGFPRQALWPLYDGDRRMEVAVAGPVTADSADTLLHLAVAGAGLIRLGDFLGEAALAEGDLVPVLTDCHDDDPRPITALVLPGRQRIPRVRAFLDFLKGVF